MRCILCFFVLGLTSAWAQPVIPNTPAGRTLTAGLEAFNSGDEDRLESYYKRYKPGQPVEIMKRFRERTGGLDLVAIDESGPRRIVFRVKERSGETTGGGAHPVAVHRIDGRFSIGVPFAWAINPISKTNWEGTGVEPDIKVPAADALETMKQLLELGVHRHHRRLGGWG